MTHFCQLPPTPLSNLPRLLTSRTPDPHTGTRWVAGSCAFPNPSGNTEPALPHSPHGPLPREAAGRLLGAASQEGRAGQQSSPGLVSSTSHEAQGGGGDAARRGARGSSGAPGRRLWPAMAARARHSASNLSNNCPRHHSFSMITFTFSSSFAQAVCLSLCPLSRRVPGFGHHETAVFRGSGSVPAVYRPSARCCDHGPKQLDLLPSSHLG